MHRVEFEWRPWRFSRPRPRSDPASYLVGSHPLAGNVLFSPATGWNMDPRCQVTEPSRAMRLLPACPEHSSCLGESKYSCCLVALLNSLDGLPSDSVVCLEKLECATRSAHHSQCTRELLKLPLLPSCCGGADPTSIRGSSWPFSSGMCCRQRGQKGKEPGSRRKWIME